jgi:hypothetical protein
MYLKFYIYNIIHLIREMKMGWKGVVRSMAAASRAAERDARRRQRELEKQQQYFDKMAELDQAAYEVEVYENYVERITSVHKEVKQDLNWTKIVDESEPVAPSPVSRMTALAAEKQSKYRPGLIARLFGLVQKQTERLESAVQDAKNKDALETEKFVQLHQQELTDWNDQVALGKKILDGDPGALKTAIEQFQSLNEIEELGSHVGFRFTDAGRAYCVVKVLSRDIIPEESKSLLKSGKLSQKRIPRGVFFELYQDYVCGVVLRVANEVLAMLPIEGLVVTAMDDVLNSKTGHIEESPIVSAYIPRNTIRQMNMSRIDPSDSMDNFIHNMDFKKTKGFSVVDEVDYPNASE